MVSQTSNTQDCHINHKARAGLRPVWSIHQSLRVLWWHMLVVIYFAASYSWSFSVIQRQDPLEFMTYSRKINFFNLSQDMRKPVFRDVRATQTQTSLSSWHFGSYFSYLVREQQSNWSDCVHVFVGRIMEYIIQLLFLWPCSFHYKKQPHHSFLITCINTKSCILWTFWHLFD